MNYKTTNEEIKKLIINDEYLKKIFRDSNYTCEFDNENWWLFNKMFFIKYFDGLDKLCDNKTLNSYNCKQDTIGYRYLIEVYNNTLTSSLTVCNCNYIETIKPFFYYYDFPKEKMNLNFQNSNFFFKKYRENCLKYINKIIDDINENKITKGIYLYSKNKTGKTYTFILLANLLAHFKRRVLFISMTTLIYKWQNIDNKTTVDYVNKKDFHQLCLKADFLFIDGIGSGYMNNWIRDNILFHILEHRLNYNKPTFFTSNFSIKELGSKFLTNNNFKNQRLQNNNSEEQIIKLLKKISELTINISWNK